jgi:hypothetical protein
VRHLGVTRQSVSPSTTAKTTMVATMGLVSNICPLKMGSTARIVSSVRRFSALKMHVEMLQRAQLFPRPVQLMLIVSRLPSRRQMETKRQLGLVSVAAMQTEAQSATYSAVMTSSRSI